MKMRKKITSIILTLSLIVTGITPAFAETDMTDANSKEPKLVIHKAYSIKDGDCGDNIEEIKDETGKTTGYNLIVPDSVVMFRMFAKIDNPNTETKYGYIVKPGTPNKVWEIGTMQLQGLTQVSKRFYKEDKPIDFKLIYGEYDSKNKKLIEGTEKQCNLFFRRKVLFKSLDGAYKINGKETRVTLNENLNTKIDKDYALRIDEKADTVVLNNTPYSEVAEFNDDNTVKNPGVVVQYETANGTVTSTSKEQEFKLSELKLNENGKKYIPIDLYYVNREGKKSETVVGSHYNIIIESEDYTPNVLCENEDIYEYDRTEEASTLKVSAIIEDAKKGKISYQWYKCLHPNLQDKRFSKIDGATEENFTPSTANVGSTEYYCEVTNTVSGANYHANSKIIRVNVNPTSASKPQIIEQPQAEISCLRGEATKISISARELDKGGVLQYQWYQAEDAQGTNARALENEKRSFLEIKQDEIGTKYYYCEVKNTVAHTYDEDGLPVGGFSDSVKSSICKVTITETPGIEYFQKDGADGTIKNPYVITSIEDLEKIREIVNSGYGLSGINFKLIADLSLPSDWEPIGNLKEDFTVTLPDGTVIESENNGANVNPFMGIFDGNSHKITIPTNGCGIFKYVRKAVIKNLNVYGERIKGSALVCKDFVDYGSSGDYNKTRVTHTVTIDNCRLLAGSKTTGAGFIRGSGSGSNNVYILNSVIEKGVVIGCDGPTTAGSFIGPLNGRIINCISYAEVNGCGGIAGYKGQSMGDCSIINSAFLGTVNSALYAGGIIGSGYNGYGSTGVNSAPNTPTVTILNCYVVADITGKGNVGGILGTEPSCECCWSNGEGTLSNNYFKGTVTETSGTGNVGGIVGFMRSFDKYQGFDSNFYNKDCGAKSGIGKIEEIITKDHKKYGATYGIDYVFDESKVCIGTNKADFANNALAAKLNAGKYSTKNWTQGKEGYPVLSTEPVVYKLALSGDYKEEYNVGEKLDLKGLVISGIYTNGQSKEVSVNDVEITKFDNSKPGDCELTIRYQVAEAKLKLKVRYADPKPAKVSLTILGDKIHGEAIEATGIHTLTSNNLETWYTGSFDANQNNTVWDILQLAAKDTKGKISFSNPMGNYVDYVTYNGQKLGEFTNGKYSGWMYTLNGTHPSLGVSEQFLNPGDSIVFHYTDDYRKEEGSDKWVTPETNKDVTTSGSGTSATTKAPTDVTVSNKTNADGTSESTAVVTVKKENQEEIIKQAKGNNSKEIVLDVAASDSKGADNIQLELPKDMVNSIVKETEATVTVKSEQGEMTIDRETLAQISKDAKGTTITVIISKVKAATEEQKKLTGKSTTVYKLTIMSGNEVISQFNGKITVKLPIPAVLLDKTVAAVHFDSADKFTAMTGKRVTEAKKDYYVFDTTHFSEFGLVDAKEAGITVDDNVDKVDKVKEAKKIASKMKLTTVATKTKKKTVKVNVKMAKNTKANVKALKDLGYNVKYSFYRATKKGGSYKVAATKKANTYTYVKGKKAKRYYYKTQIRVYDKKGKLITKTTLKNSKYASRVWAK